MLSDGVTHALILGGPKAVNTQIGIDIQDALGSGRVERLEGATRYSTAVAVAAYGVEEAGLAWDWLAVATGENFPDGLTGGLVPSRQSSVLLLTKTDTLPPVTSRELSDQADWISDLYFLGGPQAISPKVRGEVAAVLTLEARSRRHSNQT